MRETRRRRWRRPSQIGIMPPSGRVASRGSSAASERSAPGFVRTALAFSSFAPDAPPASWTAAIGKWRRSFLQDRLDGLLDKPRSGRPQTIEDDRMAHIIDRTLIRPLPHDPVLRRGSAEQGGGGNGHPRAHGGGDFDHGNQLLRVGGMAHREGTTAERGLDAYAASAVSLPVALLHRPAADLPALDDEAALRTCHEGTAVGRWLTGFRRSMRRGPGAGHGRQWRRRRRRERAGMRPHRIRLRYAYGNTASPRNPETAYSSKTLIDNGT